MFAVSVPPRISTWPHVRIVYHDWRAPQRYNGSFIDIPQVCDLTLNIDQSVSSSTSDGVLRAPRTEVSGQLEFPRGVGGALGAKV